MSTWQSGLIILGLLGAAISAGAFFAFSNFVMPALAELDEPDGIRSMQAINRKAPNATFVGAIVGAVVISLPVLFRELGRLGERPVVFLAMAIVASVASLVITLTLNVPRNDRLEATDPESADGAAAWSDYLVTWTRANTARTLTSITSVGCYVLAIGS